MKTKKFQLAHLYRKGRFYGYGIAVDGELLVNQINTDIETRVQEPCVIIVELRLDEDTISNPITIELSDFLGDKKVNS